MKISIEELKKTARNLMFDMTEEEYKALQEEFEVVMEQMELLEKIENVDEIEPMSFPFIYESIGLREDEPEEVLSVEEVLKNASDILDNQIKVKKVI